jgi:hypothetical protein
MPVRSLHVAASPAAETSRPAPDVLLARLLRDKEIAMDKVLEVVASLIASQNALLEVVAGLSEELAAISGKPAATEASPALAVVDQASGVPPVTAIVSPAM